MSDSSREFSTKHSWADRFLPAEIFHRTHEEIRRARMVIVGAVGISVVSLLAGLLHFTTGALLRGLVITAGVLPIALIVRSFRQNSNTILASHLMCASATALMLLSPFLSPGAKPIFVGLVVVPFAASALIGSRAALVWTIPVTAILAASAMFWPHSPEDLSLAWLTTILAGTFGVLATATESARERAEQEREESQALFSSIFRAAPSVLILSVVETGRVLNVNDAFTSLTGWPREAAVGKTIAELGLTEWRQSSPPVQTTEVGAQWVKDLVAGAQQSSPRHQSIEVRLNTLTGSETWWLITTEKLRAEGRDCLLSQGIDVTKHKRSEDARERTVADLEGKIEESGQELAKSREQLRRNDRLASIGTLAAGIAHQINNPIGGIVAATDFALMLEDGLSRDETIRDALDIARREAKRCGRIVKNVLKFSRNEPTDKWVEDVTPTIIRATELARHYVMQRGGELSVNLTDAPLIVRASPIDLEQVVLNLIHNAAESKNDGARIRVETRRQGDAAEIVVSDNGVGIPASAKPNIFDPFFTSRLEEGGSGLGLSVAHGIVRDHGGHIEVEDIPTGGTQIRVQLPLSKEKEEL